MNKRTISRHPCPSPAPKRILLGSFDYPLSHRVLEVVSMLTFTVLSILCVGRVGVEMIERFSWLTAMAVVAASAVGYATADFLSGLVHFLFDNFGSPDTPVLGQKFIKPFRDHHDDPTAMTQGDAVSVNADNCLVCLPFLVPVVFLLDLRSHPYFGTFFVALLFFVMVTNQLHKWAHMVTRPKFITWLQHRHLVLSVDHHRVHHTPPFNSNYCITWGILNPVLERTGFWRFALRLLRRPA
jgi:plasmanylethanolamine desaturase